MITLRVAALLVLPVSGMLQLPADRSTAALPLVVEKAQVVMREGQPPTSVEVTLRNIGSQTIVAWGVSGQVRFADGLSRGFGSGTDDYGSIGRPKPWSPVLPPGGTHAITRTPFSSSGQPIVAVSAEPTFVIFEDDTALGDEREIARFFRYREIDQRAWPVIEAIYAEAMASTRDPLDALNSVRAALAEVTDTEVRGSSAVRSLDRTLEVNLRIQKLDFAKYLANQAEDARLRRLAADAHFRRAVPGQENHERALSRAVAKWAARRVERYEYTFLERCFCPPAERTPVVFRVTAGRGVLVTTEHPRARDLGRYDSIDKLFDIIRAAIDKGAVKIVVQYDDELGYPRSVDIDYSQQIADEELRFTVSDLKILSAP